MKRPRLRIGSWLRPTLAAGIISVGVAALFLYHLGSLAPHVSPTEQRTIAASQHYSYVVHNPLHASYKTLTWVSLHIPKLPELWRARLPSVMFGLATIALASYILHRWYGRRSATFGFLIFISSPWILHVTRFAGADITYVFAMTALLAAHSYLHDHQESLMAWFVWLMVVAYVCFIPGLLWFAVLAAIWQWRTIGSAWSELSIWLKLLSLAIPLGVLGILAQAFAEDRSLITTWIGLPAVPSPSLLAHLPRQLLGTLSFIAWRGHEAPELWLGDLPLLNAFLLAGLAAGLFFYARHWQAARAQMLASYVILGVLLISLGVVSIGLIVPILYVIATAGIAYILHLWLQVFPRNPLARGFGIALIALLVGISCYYSLLQYFVAWPHNPDTKRVYAGTSQVRT